MKATPFRCGVQKSIGVSQVEMKRMAKRIRLFAQLAHEWEYEGEDVHLGSEAITVYAL